MKFSLLLLQLLKRAEENCQYLKSRRIKYTHSSCVNHDGNELHRA